MLLEALGESPFVRYQVETHLVFGRLLHKGAPIRRTVLALGLVAVGVILFVSDASAVERVFDVLYVVVVCAVAMSFFKEVTPERVLLGWLTTKLSFGMIAVGLVAIGAPISFLQGKADALPNLLLGLVWLPGLEFIPKVTPHQKILTILRTLLSVPCIYLGVQSGEWGW